MSEDVAAVMDTPDAGAVAEIETPESGLSDAPESSQSTETVDNSDTPQEGETGHLRGPELYRAIKEKLKASGLSPQEQKSIRNAIFIANKADQATGGDLTAFEREKAAYAELFDADSGETPEQRVQAIREERDFWRGFDDKWEKGDPSIIDTMVESNPASFQSITLAAMDKFSQLNNEAFSTYVSKSAFNYLNDQQIPLHLALAARFLPESSQDLGTQAVIEAFKAIKGAFDGIQLMASKKIEVKRPDANGQQPQNGNDPNLSLEQRELSVRNYEWGQEAKVPNHKLFETEMSQAATGRKLQVTAEEKQKIFAAVREEYDARLAANRSYGEAMRGYLKAGNKQAYAARAASEGKKLLPSIVARHTNAVLDARKSPVPPPKPGQQPNPKPVTPGRSDPTGVAWLSGSPASLGLQVDYNRTTNGMMQRNEAYIKGKSGLHKWKPKTQ